jgi:hypothetical protein
MSRMHRMSTDQFLKVAVNLLSKAVLEPSRTESKSLFRELQSGKTVPLTRLQMEDGSQSLFSVMMNHDEYRGHLSFSAFRDSITLLIANLVDALNAEREIRVFKAQHDPDVMLFAVTAITVTDNQPNVMMLGADAGAGKTSVALQLLYMEPSQFLQNRDETVAAGTGSGESDA